MDAKGLDLPEPIESPFDIEGHRGARTYRPENTLSAYRYGLDHGVDTLEMDIGVTKDGVLVMSHNRQVNGVHCHDTAPVTPGDPLFPYAGKNIKDLTLAQIKTLDCGFTDPGFPKQSASPARNATLQEVFDLVASREDDHVRFNIETKISPLVDDTVPYDVMTAKLVKAIEDNGLQDRAMIQSFDWRTIMLSKQLDPRIDTVGLIWQFSGADCDALDDECSLEAVQGDPSVVSPWTHALDWWQFRDVGKLLRAAHADVDSPNWQVLDPNQAPTTPATSTPRRTRATTTARRRRCCSASTTCASSLHGRRRGDHAARDQPRRRRDHLRRSRPAGPRGQAQRPGLGTVRRALPSPCRGAGALAAGARASARR